MLYLKRRDNHERWKAEMSERVKKYKMEAFRPGENRPFFIDRADRAVDLAPYKHKEAYRIRIKEKDGRKWNIIYTEL